MANAELEAVIELVHHSFQRRDAILFLGAGFSMGATTQAGDAIPSVEDLEQTLRRFVGVTSGDLPRLFAIAKGRPGFEDILKRSFRVGSVASWQAQAFQLPWLSIYTTNVDDLPQFVAEKKIDPGDFPLDFHNALNSVRSTTEGIQLPVIFLHGSVRELEHGLVFARAEYGAVAASGNEWFSALTADCMQHQIVVVGSSLREPDIMQAMQHRKQWRNDYDGKMRGFLIDPYADEFVMQVSEAELGLRVIKCTAEEFFRGLASKQPLLPRVEFLKKVGALPLSMERGEASRYIYSAFEDVKLQFNIGGGSYKTREQDLFYGARPNWWYIKQAVPAVFDVVDRIRKAFSAFREQSDQVGALTVAGPSGSGKTTAIMQALWEEAKGTTNVLSFRHELEVDVALIAQGLAGRGGHWILYFEDGAEFYFLATAVASELKALNANVRVQFLFEARLNEYNRYHEQLSIRLRSHIDVGTLKEHEVWRLFRQMAKFHALGKLALLREDEAVSRITDRQQGASGDLLVALREATAAKAFTDLIEEEFQSLGPTAREVLGYISLVGQNVGVLMVNEIGGIAGIGGLACARVLLEELAGLAFTHPTRRTVVPRHRILAEYYVTSGFKPDDIVLWLTKLLNYFGARFDKSAIMRHAREFTIFKRLVNHDEMLRIVRRWELAESIYYGAREVCGWNGLFWLQYGRLLVESGQLDAAMSCFKTGQTAFIMNGSEESFQLRHSIAETGLRIFARGSEPETTYKDAVTVLFSIAAERPRDVYALESLTRFLGQIVDHSTGSPYRDIDPSQDLRRALLTAKDRIVYDRKQVLAGRVARYRHLLQG